MGFIKGKSDVVSNGLGIICYEVKGQLIDGVFVVFCDLANLGAS